MLGDPRCFAIGLTLLACGAPAQTAAEPATGTAAEAPESAASPEPAPQSIEEQRESFVKSCLEKARTKEYCNCGFEQFKEVFKDADLSKPLEKGDPRLARLQQQTTHACASKLTEEEVRDSFLRSCIEGDERKAAYCNCAWPAMRKKLAHGDFVGAEADDPRFVEPKKAMVIECKGKFPVEIAKFEFMKGCTQGESSQEKACTCKWSKMKKQFTTEEIVAGTVDLGSAKGFASCK